MKAKYSIWQRFLVAVKGRVYLEVRGGLKIYLTKCPRHGYFEDSLHGYKEHMNCPECMKKRDLETQIIVLKAERDGLASMLLELQAAQHRKGPKVICLIGSTRFFDLYRKEYDRLSSEGNIVLGFSKLMPDELSRLIPSTLGQSREHPQPSEGAKQLHLRKIDLADEVVVVQSGGYIGTTTEEELEYARSQHKPIRIMNSPTIDKGVTE